MKIYLRESTENDASNIVKWRNSDEILQHCFRKEPITIESHLDFFRSNVMTGRYKQYIVERTDEEFGVFSYAIAAVSLKDLDLENKRCELSIFTSNDEEWNTQSQSMAIQMLLSKAFEEFDMHKVYTYVFADFDNEVELLESAGFEKEALLKKEAVDRNGQYVDVFRMAVFKK